ncbi:MAG: ECF transporter S component [Candidatus Parvarchaeota archaeon]|nr:ECF transporter S component [Candidatus Bathyarchaeota archaeon]
MLNAKKICLITVITALCLGSNYALIGIPNFKVMDFFVFVTGFVFGPVIGASVGIMIWLIYGVMNPYGFAPQVWISTMLSETIYGFAGGALGKWTASIDFNENHLSLSILFGAVGFVTTLLYDLFTNIVYAFSFRVPLLVAIITGVPFALLHEISNAIIFGVCSIPLIIALEKFIGGERFGVKK